MISKRIIPILLIVLLIISCGHLKEATTNFNTGKYASSIHLCREAISRDSTDVAAYILLLRNYRTVDSLYAASRLLVLADKRGIDSPGLERESALLAIALGDKKLHSKEYQEAAHFYNSALPVFPKDRMLLGKLADAYLQDGHLEKARTTFTAMISLGEDSSQIPGLNEIKSRWRGSEYKTRSGLSYYRKDNLDRAQTLLSEALTLNADNTEAQYYYYLTEGRLLTEKGKLTYKKGAIKNIWEAIDILAKAATLRPETAEPHFYMAQAYEKKDKREYVNAISEYEKALELEPNSPFSTIAIKKINELKAEKEKYERFWGKPAKK